VLFDLDGRIDAVVDGGDCGVGVESTVVSLVGQRPRLLRPGGITYEQLTAILGTVDIDRAVTGKISDSEKVSSPGMKYRHYAPRCPVKAICGDGVKTAEYINSSALPGDAVICYSGFQDGFGEMPVFPYGVESDLKTLAHGLFAALRKADAAGPKRIFIQCPGDSGIGLAVSNRIKKAAGFDIINME
jgi:L-threonylcarbamoyladenylate synthase